MRCPGCSKRVTPFAVWIGRLPDDPRQCPHCALPLQTSWRLLARTPYVFAWTLVPAVLLGVPLALTLLVLVHLEVLTPRLSPPVVVPFGAVPALSAAFVWPLWRRVWDTGVYRPGVRSADGAVQLGAHSRRYEQSLIYRLLFCNVQVTPAGAVLFFGLTLGMIFLPFLLMVKLDLRETWALGAMIGGVLVGLVAAGLGSVVAAEWCGLRVVAPTEQDDSPKRVCPECALPNAVDAAVCSHCSSGLAAPQTSAGGSPGNALRSGH